MLKFTYWNHKGTYQTALKQLEKLIPSEGSVDFPRSKNKNLERFRKAGNCYHDLYNNGLCNRAEEFRNVLNIASSKYKRRGIRYNRFTTYFAQSLYEDVETRIDQLVYAAAKEQGIEIVADTYPEAAEELA